MAAIGSTPFERGDEAEGFLIVTAAADRGLVDHPVLRAWWFVSSILKTGAGVKTNLSC